MAQLTTLASGSSVTLTVTDQQTIVLNNGPTDVARLSITTGPNAGRVVTASHNGRRVYGPFMAGTITVSAISGNVRYELSGDATSPLDDDGGPLSPTENTAVRALVSDAGNRFRDGPILVAHRCGSKTNTENTLRAAQQMRAANIRHLEFDVHKLADGGRLGLHHDSTIDRVTSGTGNTESQTVANWLALTNDVYTAIAPGTFAGAPTLLEDMLNWAATEQTVLWIEGKAASGNGLDTYRRINAELSARNWPRDRVIVQSFSTTVITAAAADGWQAAYLVGSGYTTADVDTGKAAGATIIGMPYGNWTAPVAAYAKSLGMQTVAYVVERRFDAQTMQGYGIDYIMSGDPVYVSEASRRTTDPWAVQQFAPGMLEGNNLVPLDTGAARGQWFSANGFYGWPTAAQADGCLQGYACPIKGNPNADTFKIRFGFQFNTVSADTRWMSIHCCASDDRNFQDSVQTRLGYNILFRRNAEVAIFTTPSGGGATQIATTGTSTNLTLDTTYVAEVDVNPTTITATLYAADGTTVVRTVSIANTHARGGYFHINRNGCQLYLIPGSLVVS